MNKLFLIPVLLFILISCEDDNDSSNVKACFTYELLGSKIDTINEVQFSNCSENASSYLWNFGDGKTSTEVEPLHNFTSNSMTVVSLTAFNGAESNTLTDTVWNWTIAYKPNIYLYPKETTSLCVNVNFPKGGELIKSIPEYEDGWCVTVEPNGKINNIHYFLFYESAQPNIWQTNEGWCVESKELSTFFNDILLQYNFSEKEIADFIEYWIPTLNTDAYYLIYPQTKSIINRVIDLEFSKKPTNLFRLFFAFKESEDYTNIAEPTVKSANREEFYVIEWGGVIL